MIKGKEENGFWFPIRNIVFATDFLESSRLALDFAVAFSHHYNAKLTIVHVFELPTEAEEVELLTGRRSVSREHALSRLEAFAEGVRRLGVSTETDLREGEPCGGVLASAAERNADLLVLGTHGIYRGVQHLLVGSNAERILSSAKCPALTVGRHVMAGIDLDLKLREIMAIFDSPAETTAVARHAEDLGRDLGIPVRGLQVASEAENTQDPASARRSQGPSARPSLPSSPGAELRFEGVFSPEQIVQIAERTVDSLIVTGVRPVSRWDRHFRTSFAYELVAKARSPLLSIQV